MTVERVVLRRSKPWVAARDDARAAAASARSQTAHDFAPDAADQRRCGAPQRRCETGRPERRTSSSAWLRRFSRERITGDVPLRISDLLARKTLPYVFAGLRHAKPPASSMATCLVSPMWDLH